MLIWSSFMIAFSLLILVSIGIVLYKVLIKKKNIDHLYTPFDYIAGQSTVEFHDEKEEKEENQEAGDDKDKNEVNGV